MPLQPRVGGQEPVRVLARVAQHLVIAGQVRDAELGQPVLARAEELAGPAQAQVLLRDAEPVVRVLHDAQPRARLLGQLVRDEEAVRRGRAAADPSTQLMQR